jgi:hypothetical protein
MPEPRKPNYDRDTHQATTVYLEKALHAWARQYALELGAAEGATVSQSELINRALAEMRARVQIEGSTPGGGGRHG